MFTMLLPSSPSRRAITVSFFVVVTLIPTVCNAGVLAPVRAHVHDTHASSHPSADSMTEHGTHTTRHFTSDAARSCRLHNGHACCLFTARKTLRQDAFDVARGDVSGVASHDAITATMRRRALFPAPIEPLGPPTLAGVNAPLLR